MKTFKVKRWLGKSILLLYPVLMFMGSSSCQNAKSKLDTETYNKPNIIVLFLDDAGYADFGFTGSQDLKTPNIDKLAQNGVVFTDAHVSASVCGPSRAGLITGRYQQRFGFECNPSGDFTGVALDVETIGDAMQKAGYRTSAFGKWHLGHAPEYRPNARGFDYYWGFLSGGRHYFPNEGDDREGDIHSIRENDTFTSFEGYLTDKLGEQAAKFIHENKEQPFFMYWAPNAVHTPMEATDEDLALFPNHPRQTLAAMTWALDRAVGILVKQLEEDKLLDNTLIFFLSDNGGAHNNQSSNLPLKGFKGNKYEGGHRVPFFVHWPAQLKGGNTYDGLTSSLDIFATSIDAAGQNSEAFQKLDGVSLLPYLIANKKGEPHEELFWRKDQAAAIRKGDYKLIRVDDLGYRMYNLEEDLGELNNLAETKTATFETLKSVMSDYDDKMMSPLWTEGHDWDTITWMIHEDLYLNREVRVKDIGQLKNYRKKDY